MTKIAIFDDNKSFLESLTFFLKDNPSFYIVGTFNNAIDAVKKVNKSTPDIIIMDIKMPEVSGIQAVKEIKAKYPEIQILMHTVFEDDGSVFAAICAGASGYILKGTSPNDLLAALEEIKNGGSPMTPSIARQVLTLFQNQFQTQTEFYDLSPREKDILRCLVDGQSYKMIAESLTISYHTVNAHIRKVYEKLHVNSSQEAISKAIRERLV
ncbi:DNA-binding response regulator [Lacihabitans sp. LS3-19]|uniref:response regulator transcription factor n=1 Tax=Lacihabitans sp. LS3-19 TaxID=2487335 RepID=UPI0020CCAB16|nr:response regulator transcription factor [Lacihabitans sp. LS3-19]MCP9766508.1 DNA-binding response regulator [Lacihabitans sp. LS3-19]